MDNRGAMMERLNELNDALTTARAGGGEKYVTRHHARGRLLPRERIELLVDRDTPFLELCAVAGFATDYPVGGSLVGGIGVVEGVECMIIANDPTVRGGSVNPITLKKSHRLGEIAAANRLPLINLVESGGADLPAQAEIFIPGGRVFRDLTRASAEHIPTIAVVFGNATAGGAYLPGMSDYTIFVKNQASVYLAGPPLVKMATGEETDDESLGGAMMHATQSGLADFVAVDERDAIRLTRTTVVPPQLAQARPGTSWFRCRTEVRRRGPARDRLVRSAGSVRSPRDPGARRRRQRLRRVQAALRRFPRDRLGAGRRLSDRRPGQRPRRAVLRGGTEGGAVHPARERVRDTAAVPAEHDRLHGRLAVRTGGHHQARRPDDQRGRQFKVPHITLNIGASYGAGNYGMCGRAFDPRFLFTWPNARSAVMGSAQLAGVLSIISRQAAAATGREFDHDSDAAMEAMVTSQIDEQSTALYLSGRLYDDGVIDPRDTRTILGICLSAIHNGPVQGADGFGVFRL